LRTYSNSKFFSLFVLFLLLVVTYSFAGDTIKKDTAKKYFLDMKGKVTQGKKALNRSFIRIYADSSPVVMQKIETDNEGWLAFQLPLQKFYTIKVSKVGYVTKIITVDAHMPKSFETGDYYFEFSIDLFEEIQGLDVSLLKDPVTKIFFNTFNKGFDYDYNYTVKINNDVKKLYQEYQQMLKAGKKQTPGDIKKPDETASDTAKKQTTVVQPPVVKKNTTGITFSIELFSSNEQVQKNSPQFKSLVNVKEYQDGTSYVYYVGEYQTIADAEKMKERIAGYFPSAAIIAFKEGKKLDLDEALKQTGK